MTKKSEFHYGLTPYLNCKDYLVSNETYEVMISNKYDILVTSPVPLNLNKYYNSKAYTSHTDSKKKLIDYLYQIIKKISIKKKYNLIKGFHTQNKILDIGAGTGDFLHFFNLYSISLCGPLILEKSKLSKLMVSPLLYLILSSFSDK